MKRTSLGLIRAILRWRGGWSALATTMPTVNHPSSTILCVSYGVVRSRRINKLLLGTHRRYAGDILAIIFATILVNSQDDGTRNYGLGSTSCEEEQELAQPSCSQMTSTIDERYVTYLSSIVDSTSTLIGITYLPLPQPMILAETDRGWFFFTTGVHRSSRLEDLILSGNHRSSSSSILSKRNSMTEMPFRCCNMF